MSESLKTIAVDQIDPAPDNLRQEFTDIDELARSIDFIGLIEPIRLTKVDGRYQILAGHRRFEAIVQLGWEEVKALVQTGKVSESDRTAGFLIENMQRVDLDITEQTEGVRRLITDFGMTRQQVSDSLGVSLQWVRDRCDILNVPEHVFDGDRQGRQLPVDALATLGKLDADRIDRLTKDDKVPSQYDIEVQMQKQTSKANAEKRLRKLVKDGYLAVSEKELKEIMKTELAECDGIRQMVKLKIGAAEAIREQYWETPESPVLDLKRIHFPDKHEFEKNTVYVVKSAGGFMEWHEASVFVPGEVDDDQTDEPDECDKIDAINDELRQDYTAECEKAEIEYVKNAKPAELVNAMLVRLVSRMREGYNSRYYAEVFDRLDLEFDIPDLTSLSFTERDEVTAEMFDVLWAYASKNAANLARAVATCELVVDRRHNFPIEYPATPDYLDYPEEADELTPLETGV